MKVFATRRPIGVYLTNVSFQIDSDAPTFWATTANVTQETFNTLVYTSPGSLSTGDGLHRITITNLGSVFWLVYFEVTTPDTSSGNNASSTASPSVRALPLPPGSSGASDVDSK